MSDQKSGAYGKVERKKSERWDMEEMERRAKERKQREKELREDDELRALGKSTKKRVREDGPSVEVIAEARSERLILESAIGKIQVVQGGPSGKAPGFHCKVCDRVLKDNKSYMDHINGRNHLKKLGVNTRAVREDVSDVHAKMEELSRKLKEPKKDKLDLDARLEEVKRQEDREKAEKRERKKQKKSEKKTDDATDDGGMDPAMAAMMGFSGFGSSKS